VHINIHYLYIIKNMNIKITKMIYNLERGSKGGFYFLPDKVIIIVLHLICLVKMIIIKEVTSTFGYACHLLSAFPCKS
jgi:hypothetical protein